MLSFLEVAHSNDDGGVRTNAQSFHELQQYKRKIRAQVSGCWGILMIWESECQKQAIIEGLICLWRYLPTV